MVWTQGQYLSLDSDDDLCTGCRNVSLHHQQQSISGLHSPRWSHYNFKRILLLGCLPFTRYRQIERIKLHKSTTCVFWCLSCALHGFQHQKEWRLFSPLSHSSSLITAMHNAINPYKFEKIAWSFPENRAWFMQFSTLTFLFTKIGWSDNPIPSTEERPSAKSINSFHSSQMQRQQVCLWVNFSLLRHHILGKTSDIIILSSS